MIEQPVARAGARYRLFNHYGPSETSVVATAGEVAPGAGEPPAIGAALDNVRVSVLYRPGQPAPRGVPGWLHIGGRARLPGHRRTDTATHSASVG
ncbi:AMP-binding protein, partial [Burkholderia pseudomallei]|uniref:AMP-binding protein n=1 Tax=Burkholderia pseudomallei TaxID=28450 RepID=UPI0021564488